MKNILPSLCISKIKIKPICPSSSYVMVTFEVTNSLVTKLSLPWTCFDHISVETGIGRHHKGLGFYTHQHQCGCEVRKTWGGYHLAYSACLCCSFSLPRCLPSQRPTCPPGPQVLSLAFSFSFVR